MFQTVLVLLFKVQVLETPSDASSGEQCPCVFVHG